MTIKKDDNSIVLSEKDDIEKMAESFISRFNLLTWGRLVMLKELLVGEFDKHLVLEKLEEFSALEKLLVEKKYKEFDDGFYNFPESIKEFSNSDTSCWSSNSVLVVGSLMEYIKELNKEKIEKIKEDVEKRKKTSKLIESIRIPECTEEW